jgi:hypothetical protein
MEIGPRMGTGSCARRAVEGPALEGPSRCVGIMPTVRRLNGRERPVAPSTSAVTSPGPTLAKLDLGRVECSSDSSTSEHPKLAKLVDTMDVLQEGIVGNGADYGPCSRAQRRGSNRAMIS